MSESYSCLMKRLWTHARCQPQASTLCCFGSDWMMLWHGQNFKPKLWKKKRRNGEDAWMAFLCLEFGGMSLACQKAVQFYKFEMFDSSFPYLNKFCWKYAMTFRSSLKPAQMCFLLSLIVAPSQPGLFPRYIYPREWLIFMVNVG